MKFKKIGITTIITLLTTVATSFILDSSILFSSRSAFSQPTPSTNNNSKICQVRSQSMLPNINLYDNVLVDRLSYRSQPPKRGDIVIFKPTESMMKPLVRYQFTNFDDVFIVKRVIGLPGERLWIVGGKVYVNNQPLKEKYIRQQPTYSYQPVTIPPKSYFVLGDNRNNSYDSHKWGFVTQDSITGQVVKIYGKNSSVKSELEKQQLSNRNCQLF
jgi:signal peptidase I